MPNILLIDDDPHMVTLLKTLLEIEGFQVATSDGTGEIQQVIRQSQPDAILLDIHLHEANGLEIVSEIRRDPDFATTKIVMTSGMHLAPE